MNQLTTLIIAVSKTKPNSKFWGITFLEVKHYLPFSQFIKVGDHAYHTGYKPNFFLQ